MNYTLGLVTMGTIVFMAWLDVDERVGLSLFVLAAIAMVILEVRRK